MRFEVDFEDGLVDKWKPTGLLKDIEDKESLAQMLEFNYQYLKGPVSLRGDSEYVASMALPLTSRIFRESGETSFEPTEMIDSVCGHLDNYGNSEMFDDNFTEEMFVEYFSEKYVQDLN